jgi:predicted DNA-binding transcriptional regulator AlpA
MSDRLALTHAEAAKSLGMSMTEFRAMVESNAVTIVHPHEVPLSKRLWNADECAEYLRLSVDQWRDRTSPRPGVPRPIRLGNGPKAPLRWVAQEVIDWALSQRG